MLAPKTSFLTAVLISLVTNSFAQNLPTITPPSPAAQAFMRYGEIPVDYSTGVPNISVPLYTVKGKKLELPISVSYHASGIKVNDIASEVGLGWVLNSGGMISRTVNGKADEIVQARAFTSASQLKATVTAAAQEYNTSCGCLKGILDYEEFFSNAYNDYDNMNDRFFYTLPGGGSGVFMFDYANDQNVITLPYRPVKVIGYAKGQPLTNGLKIIDENGVSYKFSPLSGYYVLGTYSEWYLTQMVSADASDTINLNYTAQPANMSSYQSFSYTLAGPATEVQGNSNGCSPRVSDFTTVSMQASPITQFYSPVLSSIESAGTVVNFNYYKDRADFNNLHRLSDITVYSRNSTVPVKKIYFAHKYFGTNSTDYRLGLDSIIVSGSDNSYPDKYSFTYESQSLPAYPFKMEDPRYKTDLWGYYNGSNNPVPVPRDFIQDATVGTYYGATTRGDNDFARSCMIKEIKYPTGGRTVFYFGRYYAANIYPEFSGSFSDGYTGGFRIDSIKNYNGKNMTGMKTYEYNNAVAKKFTREYFNNKLNFFDGFTTPGDQGSTTICKVDYARNMIYESPVLPREAAPGLPVVYTMVTEYHGSKFNNTGKTVYNYMPPYSPVDFENNPDHPIEYESPWFYHPYHYDKGNYVPELYNKTEYAFNGTSYYPVTKTLNTYNKYFTKTYATGIKLNKTKMFTNPAARYTFILLNGVPIQPIIDEYLSTIIAIDTKAYQEASLISKSEQYVYDQQDPSKYVLTTTTYNYNEQNLAYKDVTKTLSNSDLATTSYKYPFDVSGTVYQSMVSRNMLTPVVEQTESRNGSFLKRVTNTYRDWGNNVIAPETVASKVLDNNAEVLLRYHSYDTYANLQTVSKENDAKRVYVWGYNGLYPVAEVINSDYTTVNNIVSQLQVNAATGLNSNDATVRALLNNIRTALPQASVTTYTYKPLVGVTSQTDPAGRTTYYEYDGQGRLHIVKDQDGKIVKMICYNYAGEVVGCSGEAKPNWQPTGNTRCKPCDLNSNFLAPVKQVEMRDVNTASASYNQYVWDDDPDAGVYMPCLESGWQNTSNVVCEKEMGYNTGNQMQEQRNNNPCSPFYNQTRWVVTPNASLCPKSTVYSSQALSGYYVSQVCPLNYSSNAVLVNLPAGMFTSTVSLADANLQASQYAQNYANQQGVCYLPSLSIPVTNYNPSLTLQLTVRTTQGAVVGSVTVGPNGGSQTLSLTAGTYNISVQGNGSFNYDYEIGGSFMGSQNGAFGLNISNVNFNTSINYIYFY